MLSPLKSRSISSVVFGITTLHMLLFLGRAFEPVDNRDPSRKINDLIDAEKFDEAEAYARELAKEGSGMYVSQAAGITESKECVLAMKLCNSSPATA